MINTGVWRGYGAGEDVFELGDNLINPIRDTGTGLALMTLHGNPYGPSTDAAILRLGTDTRQPIATLHILDRGVLDFGTGGMKPVPNILYLNQLTLNDVNARLTVRNWIHQAGLPARQKSVGQHKRLAHHRPSPLRRLSPCQMAADQCRRLRRLLVFFAHDVCPYSPSSFLVTVSLASTSHGY